MKYSEMNLHQQKAFNEMREVYSEIIGGTENILLDFPEDSTDYQDAKKWLAQPAAELANIICEETFKQLRDSDKNMKFAGKDWLKERIIRRLSKDGYTN
jgi:hypothetical protein